MLNKKITFLVIGLALLVTISLSFAINLSRQWQAPLSNQKAQFLTVKNGESMNQLCRRMKQRQWLTSCFAVRVMGKLDPAKVQIKSGTYQIQANIKLNDLVNKLVEGVEHQFSFTIIEGENLYQVLDKVGDTKTLKNDLADFSQLPNQFELDLPSLEGMLAPDTYFYTAGTPATDLFKRAIQKQQLFLEEAWKNRKQDLPLASAYELLIIASIIEKESAVDSEHTKIASVFYNRLNSKMRLQTDPTVIYGVWDEYEGDIKRVHLKTKTPYNTYRINGLPPTPIANPSHQVIRAAANPIETEYLYFVASGQGGHTFNKTLKAHNQALRKYLQWQKENSQ